MAGEGLGRTLGDYFTLQRGTTYKSRLLGQPGPVLLGLATIQRNGGFRSDSLRTYGGDSPEKLLVHPGDIFVSLKDVTQSADLLGAVARLPRDHLPGRLTQDTVKLEPTRADVPLDYLYWVLRTPQYRNYCRAHATGTTNLGLSRDDFLAFPAREPSPSQQRLVNVLNGLEDKIELNGRTNETLEALARALFKSWFVDFDPVRTRVIRHQPSGMDAATAKLFPRYLDETPFGETPAGWRVGTLGDLVGLQNDRIAATSAKDSARYIALDDMPSRSLDVSRYRQGSSVTSSIVAFQKGDILFGSMRPYFHKVGLAFFDGITRTTTFVLRPRRPVNRYFALMHLFSDEVVAHATAASVGTTIPYVRWAALETYPVVIPPDSLLARFGEILTPVLERIGQLGEENSNLEALRNALLPRLLSGEFSIQGAERAIEATA